MPQRHADINWKEQVREAIRERRFELWFQPIMQVSTGKITSHEALVRLRDGKGTVIPPDLFLPAANRFRITPKIDQYVMQEAARFLAIDPRCGVDQSFRALARGTEAG